MTRRTIAVLALAGLLAVGCSNDAEEQPSPPPTTTSPSPSPSPSPTPVAQPVQGEGTVQVVYAGDEQIVNHKQRKKPKRKAIEQFVTDVTTWLDGHLSVLQTGEPGNLGVVMPDALQTAAGPGQLAAITTGLASPELLVESAVYQVKVFHSGAPLWLSVSVKVTHLDGSRASARLVFEPQKDGPQLVAFDAGKGGGA